MNSISNKAVLVKLFIAQFNPKRADKPTTYEVLKDHSAKASAGFWIKNLVDPKTLASVTACGMAARMRHYDLTMPWYDDGIRILPTNVYLEYQERMRAAKALFKTAVDKFMLKYPSYITEASSALSTMFDASEYPDADTVRSKFSFDVTFSPIPSKDDFRVKIQADELKSIKTDLESRLQDASKNALADLWRRLAEPIKGIADKLSDENKTFKNATFENLRTIIETVKKLNLTGDSMLDALASETLASIGSVNPDTVRDNDKLRNDTAIKAAALYEKMKGYIA